METSIFTDAYARHVSQVEEWLRDVYPTNLPLSEAVNYSLLAGGKRLRAVFSLAVAELLGIQQSYLRSVACAVELVHTASLVHDDLPALDNDSIRRGKPTCHRVFGEGIALLAGDELFVSAHRIIAEDQLLFPECRVQLLSELSHAVGALCQGQALDLKQTGLSSRELEYADLELRHRLKTGALFSFCSVAPALILVADPQNLQRETLFSLEQLRLIGEQLGLLFQITDDILGATSTTEVLGKQAGIDGSHGVATFVSYFGIDGARARAQQTLTILYEQLDSAGSKGSFLRELCCFAMDRHK